MTTINERFEQMQPAFDLAAASIVDQLKLSDYAEIRLSPGDATCYHFIIAEKGRDVLSIGPEGQAVVTPARDYMVTLTLGGSYPWGGQHMHWDYCAEKWGDNGRAWTGRVVCALLNAISTLINQEEA